MRSVSPEQPIFAAIERSLPIARHDPSRAPAPSGPPARGLPAHTKTDDHLLSIAPSSQGSEPPGNPARFRAPPYVALLARLTFLAPDITRAILEGCRPPGVTVQKLIAHAALPLAWPKQRQLLGFACSAVNPMRPVASRPAASLLHLHSIKGRKRQVAGFVDCICRKSISVGGAPVCIAGKRRTPREISNPERRDQKYRKISYLGGGGSSLERTRLQVISLLRGKIQGFSLLRVSLALIETGKD